MNPTIVGLLAFAFIFGFSLLGMRLRTVLPTHHLSGETKDSVRLGMGLVATMTALLLGLLVASAKGSYDAQRTQVIQIAAKIAFLDRALATYGPETAESRELLRRAVENAIHRIWPDKNSENTQVTATALEAKTLYESIHNLAPHNELQQSLKAQALEGGVDISKSLWLLSVQEQPSIVTAMLIAVIAWLAVIFLSFGLFAPANKTVIATLMVVALSVSTAIFLIMEVDRPFTGAIRISSAPMQNVLNHLGQ